jgi:ribosomal protein S18 acetylase RimI-like enzyme
MDIENSSSKDIDEIFRIYEIARNFQKIKGAVLWPTFERTLIETEISEKRQWKILIDNQIACVWAITFTDPQIWEERNSDPSIYIHRIATNPNFRGKNLVEAIVKWAKNYAKENNKQFIRMDTVGENKGLIGYYEKCGFDFLGLLKLKNTSDLPAHYNNATVSLFEMTAN